MNPLKLKVYLEISQICLVAAIIYLDILGSFFGVTKPMDGVLLAFNVFMMVRFNETFRELWDKWRGK